MSDPNVAAPAAPGTTWKPAPSLVDVRSGKTVLERGQRGESVRYLQQQLDIPDDGKFGGDTEKAVAAFQQKHGMQIDPGYLGKAGRFTLAAIEQAARLPADIVVAPASAGNFDSKGHLEKSHPELRKRFTGVVARLAQQGIKIRITDGLRTFEEQDALYRKGRHLVNGEWKCINRGCAGIVTSAPGGYSNHNWGLAIDCYPVLDGKVRFTAPPSQPLKDEFIRAQKAIGVESERAGLTWGGRWSNPYDPPHVQLLGQNEMNPRECLRIYRENGNSRQAVWDEATRRVKQKDL